MLGDIDVLLASSINLAPDATVLPMLGIFLFVLIVLTVFVFRPVLKIIDARRLATDGARECAAECDTNADRLEEEIARATDAARSSGAHARAGQRAHAEKAALEIIAAARAETTQILAHASAERASTKTTLAKSLDKQLPALTELFAAHARFDDKAVTK